MKKFIYVFLLLFAFVPANPVKAQDLPAGMTVAALEQFVDNAINKLTNAGTTLLGNGSIVIDGASSQMSALLTQLNGLVQSDLTRPIQELSGDIKNLSNQLYSTASRINAILNQQQSCLLLNAQIVLASIQSITSELKNGIPIISKDAPRLNYFQFDNHTPSVVPKNGGRVKIIGFNLWTTTSLPPDVSILNNERTKVLLVVHPERSNDNNSFSFILDTGFINRTIGLSLQIKVQPKKKDWFSVKELGEYYLPISIPASYNQQLKLIAHLQYPYSVSKADTLEYRNFFFDNPICEHNAVANHQECWTFPNGPQFSNCQIIGYVFSPGSPSIRNTTNVSVAFAGNCITAAGSLDNATCVQFKVPPFGPTIAKLLHSTFWNARIAPRISYTFTSSSHSDAEGAFIKIEDLVTNLCVDIDKTYEGDLNNVFWFEVVQTDGKTTTTLYSSARSTGDSIHDQYKGLAIDATLNSIPVNGKSQICVKVTRPQCGF